MLIVLQDLIRKSAVGMRQGALDEGALISSEVEVLASHALALQSARSAWPATRATIALFDGLAVVALDARDELLVLTAALVGVGQRPRSS